MKRSNRREFLTAMTCGALAAAGFPARGTTLADPAADDIDPADRAALDALAEAFRRDYGVPGLAVAIAREGCLVFAAGYGMADPASGDPVTPHHLFRTASIAKPITSVCVLRLAEQGKLRLDDRVLGDGALLGTTYGMQPYGSGIEDITVRHLLEHTAGGWPNDDGDPMFLDPDLDHPRLISRVLDRRPLDRPPGDAYAYSNFGYCLLGRVIERVTGKTYAQAVADEVLAPCGITNMHLAGNTLVDRRHDEVAYVGQGEGEDPYGMNVARMDAHGGWLASAVDLVRLAVHVDGFDGVPDLLAAASIAEMAAPSTANAGYAKGWFVNQHHNWWHTGSLPGTATILVRTSGGFCWSVLCNTRRLEGNMFHDLDQLPWNMAGCVRHWPEGAPLVG